MEEEQEFEQVTVKQIGMKWGLFLGMAMIIYGLIQQVAGLVGNQAVGWLSYLVLAALVYFAQKSFKDDGDGFMSYKQGLGIGTLMSAVAGVLNAIFTFIYLKFVDDSLIQITKDIQLAEMIESGTPEAQIDQAMEITSKFLTPEVMSVMIVIFTVLFGFIISLIVSAITKNPDPSQEI